MSETNKVPERYFILEGTSNVRDLGGYLTVDGYITRWQTLLRADGLDKVPHPENLKEYGVRTIIDLRRTEEVSEQPDTLALSEDFSYHHKNMAGDSELEVQVTTPPLERVGVEFWTTFYTTLLDQRRLEIVDILILLSSPGTLPALFHCAAGKDRTGVIAALVLSLLGVPSATVAEEYSLTARYLHPKFLSEYDPLQEEQNGYVIPDGYSWQDYQNEHCPTEAMLSTLCYLEERYGGVESYVVGAGMSETRIKELRNSLLER